MSNRKPGFYRVFTIWSNRWIVAEWTGGDWLEPGYEKPGGDWQYSEIDESPIGMGKS